MPYSSSPIDRNPTGLRVGKNPTWQSPQLPGNRPDRREKGYNYLITLFPHNWECLVWLHPDTNWHHVGTRKLPFRPYYIHSNFLPRFTPFLSFPFLALPCLALPCLSFPFLLPYAIIHSSLVAFKVSHSMVNLQILTLSTRAKYYCMGFTSKGGRGRRNKNFSNRSTCVTLRTR